MYSAQVVDHFERPRNVGMLTGEGVTVGQEGVPGHGNFLLIFLRLDGGARIVESRFQTYGCPAAVACGSWVSDWVVGKSVADAALLQPGQVMEGLGGLPLGREHCAYLAVSALQDAVGRLNSGAEYASEAGGADAS